MTKNWSFFIVFETRLKTKKQFKYKLGIFLMTHSLSRTFATGKRESVFAHFISRKMAPFCGFNISLTPSEMYTSLHIMKNKTVMVYSFGVA